MNSLQMLGCIGMPAMSVGHGANADVLKVERSVVIDAPVADVWARCGDFDAIDKWLGPVAKTALVRGKNNQPGAVRHLDVGGGGFVDEELTAYDAAGYSFQYRILDGVLPVSDYQSDFRASASGSDHTRVTWSSTFRRKDTSDKPAAGVDDKAALEAITGLYENGLADLKRAVEGG